MAELAYQKVINKLQENIESGKYNDSMRIPDERSLSEEFNVSRSTIKRALNIMANKGIVFKKQGSGTFINPLYIKGNSFFNYTGSNLGITDSFKVPGKKQSIKLLSFDVVKASKIVRESLFLSEDDFVYEFKRLRLIDNDPFLIETSYIPIKLWPEFNQEIASGSIFSNIEANSNLKITNSYLRISTEPSSENDQELLKLTPTEPVGIMEGIFFLNNGTPFELSSMRIHYKYMNYNTFVSVD